MHLKDHKDHKDRKDSNNSINSNKSNDSNVHNDDYQDHKVSQDYKDYFAQFDISEEESKLKMLLCSPDPIPKTANISWMDPQQFLQTNFAAQSFHLALCFNLFFINTALSENFHLETLLKMLRLASEVRIAPLLDAAKQPSVHLGPVLQVLHQKGYGVELRETRLAHNLQKGAMLRLWNPVCEVSRKALASRVIHEKLG